MKEIFHRTLTNPGPDVVVCDEGHILKNEKTSLSYTINKINTKRRIALTGTPLQNNLLEYHCMIQFVMPNLLGTRKEFEREFVKPIEQGQCREAKPKDVAQMKKRAHILHKMVEKYVQRFDCTVLQSLLPKKYEYVLSVQMSPIQCRLYEYYLDNLAQGGPRMRGTGLFQDFGVLSCVWLHPRLLGTKKDDDNWEKYEKVAKRMKREHSYPKKTGVVENGEGVENGEVVENGIEFEENEVVENGRVPWWERTAMDCIGPDLNVKKYLSRLKHSGKLVLLLDILRTCTAIGDKVLVFSQFLMTLDVIEHFLHKVSKGYLRLPHPDGLRPLPYQKWIKGLDYHRLDGSTSVAVRKRRCESFNEPDN